MENNSDYILDRIKLRSSITRWRALAILSVFLIMIVLLTNYGKSSAKGALSYKGSNYIAKILLKGVISNDAYDHEVLEEIKDNKKIKALIVHIDSPGGTPVGGEGLYLKFREIAKEKPVIAVMDEVATSGAYMAAVGCDYIIAREGTITGSIGVIALQSEFTELADKLGIKINTLKTSEFKASPNPYEKLTPAVREAVDELLFDTYDMFYAMVKESRKLSDEQMKPIANGKVFLGKKAMKLGLIDKIGGEKEALEWLDETKQIKDLSVKYIDITIEPKGIDAYLSSISSFIHSISSSTFKLLLK